MAEQPSKKVYTSPEIFEVPLRQEQAVLATCHTAYSTASGTSNKCNSGGCKKSSVTGAANVIPAC